MRGEASISGVYKLGQTAEPKDPMAEYGRIESLRRHAWKTCGVIAVRPCELPDDLGAQLLAWAEGNYGQR